MNKNLKEGSHRLYDGDRFVNFRPVLLLCVAFGAGILLFYFFGLHSLLFCLLFVPVAAAAFAVRLVKRRKVGKFVLFSLLLCAVFAVGAFSLSFHLGAFESSPVVEGDCTVVGTVEEIGAAGFGEVLTLRDVSLVTEDGQEIAPDGKMMLYAPETEAEIGMLVYAEAEVTVFDVHSYGRMNTNAVIGGIRYRGESNEVYVAGEGRMGMFDAVRSRVREVLFAELQEDTAPIAYAMLLGDSGYMEEDVLQNFRYGGIAHIFAVSGLHIGIVYGIVAFVLRKLYVNRWVRVPVVALVLVFYAGICGFSPSAVRALVMCLTLSVAEAGGWAYDKLNSVSLAAFAVMILHPVYLFSVGFQLSVAAAAGIIVLGGHLSRLLARIRFLPKRLGSAVAVCFSAQLCTFPILLDCFGYASVLGLVLNLLFIPLIGMVYSVLFVCTALAAVMPFAGGVLLFLPECMLGAVVAPVLMLEFKVLLISGFSFGGLASLFYGAVYAFSDKINLRPLPRAVLVFFLLAVLVVCMLVRNNAFGYGHRLSLHSYYGENNVLLLRSEGECCMIVTGVPDRDYLERLFLQEGVDRLDAVIILSDAGAANAAVPVLLQYAEVDALYVPSDSILQDPFRTVELVRQDGFFSFGGADARFYGEEILYLNIEGTGLVVAAEGAEFTEPLPHARFLITDTEDELLRIACMPEREIVFRKGGGNISVYDTGDLQILWRGDIISVTGTG